MRSRWLILLIAMTAGCRLNPFRTDEPLPPPAPYPVNNEPIPIPNNSPAVEWPDNSFSLRLEAPPQLAPGQDLGVRIDLSNNGVTTTEPLTIRHPVPSNGQLLRTDPPAQLQGNQLVWQLPPMSAGQKQSLLVMYRPSQPGPVALSVESDGADNRRKSAKATTQVGVIQLAVRVEGPDSATVGERIAYDARITNSGQGLVSGGTLRVDLPPGLEHESMARTVEIPFAALAPGESKLLQVPVIVRQAGRSTTTFRARCEGVAGVAAERTLDVRDVRLNVLVSGPTKTVINQQTLWDVKVVNPGTLPVANAQVRVQLPRELAFAGASDGARIVSGLVTWTILVLPPNESREFQLTTKSIVASPRTTLSATVVAPGGGEQRSDKSLEIVGVPMLKVDLKANDDNIGKGGQVTYSVELRNTGSTALNDVELIANMTPQLKTVFGFGPTLAQVQDNQLRFGRIATLEPGRSVIYRFEAEAVQPGDARVTVQASSTSLTDPVVQNVATRVAP